MLYHYDSIQRGAQGWATRLNVNLKVLPTDPSAPPEMTILEHDFKSPQAIITSELTGRGRKALAIRLDVTSSDSINNLVDQVVNQVGRIDILVNNSGISPVWKRAEDTSEEVWNQIIATNLTGTFLCAQAVGRVMINQKSGKIINMTSVGGEVALPKLVAYCASKAGIVMLTKVLAAEWARHNILVNGIGPSFVETDFTAGLRANDVIYNDLMSKNPLKRFAKPEEKA